MKRGTEQAVPYVAGTVVAATYWIALRTFQAPDVLKDMMFAIVGMAGVLVGFLGTMLTILLTISDKQIVVQMRKAGRYSSVVSQLLHAIYWSGGLAVLSVIAMGIHYDPQKTWCRYAAVIWFFEVTVTVMSYLRAIRIIAKVVRSTE